MKKKILIINNSSHISGAEVSLLTLLNSLHQTYDFTVVIPEKGNLYSELINSNVKTKLFDLKRFSKTSSYFGQIKWLFQGVSTAIKIARDVRKQNFDVVYANGNQAIIHAILVKIFTGKKLIWHVRDNLKNKFIAQTLARFSNKILCISNYIEEQVPAKKNKKFLVYNGIDCNHWIPAEKDNSIIDELNLAKNTLLVGNVGQLIPWKNHLYFIEIAEIVLREFKSVHFLIIGYDLFNKKSSYVAMLKNKVKEKNLEKHVTFLGYKENVKHYINQLDILAHCATTEPFGRVVMEASALKKPVVAYDAGGVKEIIAHHETGFLSSPNDHQQFAENLLHLLKDSNLRTRFGNAGRKEICEKFSLENMSREIQKVIDQT